MPGRPFKPSNKKQDKSKPTSKPPSKPGKKPASTKNQIRSLERLLQRDLPPKVKEKAQQKLKQLQQQLVTAKSSELERLYATRYHKVRFFERQKLERRLKRLKAAAANSDSPDSQSVLLQTEADLQYVLHFPKGHKYVSILKTAATPEAQAQLDQQRATLRTLARQQAADAAALGEGDEGRSLGMLQADARQAAPADDDDDFFLKPGKDLPAGEGPGQEAQQLSAVELPSQPARKRQKLTKPAAKAQQLPHVHNSSRKAAGSLQHAARQQQSGGSRHRPAAELHAPAGRGPKQQQAARPSVKSSNAMSGAQLTAPPQSAARSKSHSAAHRPSGPRAGVPAQPAHRPVHRAPALQAPPAQAAAARAPQRTRAEGGRKRRRN